AEDVLVHERQPGERAGPACRECCIRSTSGPQRFIGRDGDEGVQRVAAGLDTLQAGLDELDARELAGPQPGRQLRKGSGVHGYSITFGTMYRPASTRGAFG